jgi:hypothetical protein
MFVLRIVDKNGARIDTSQYIPDSLLSAATIGHVYQSEDGGTATIIDASRSPHERYRIDPTGEPIPV